MMSNKQKTYGDMLLPYTKSDIWCGIILSGVLSVAMVATLSVSNYYVTMMLLPCLLISLVYTLVITLTVKPIRFLPYFDAHIGVKPEWINGKAINAMFLNLFYVIPMLFVLTGVVTSMYQLGDYHVVSETTQVQYEAALEEVYDAGTAYELAKVELYRQSENAKTDTSDAAAKLLEEKRAVFNMTESVLAEKQSIADDLKRQMEEKPTAGAVYWSILKSVALQFIASTVFWSFFVLWVYEKQKAKKAKLAEITAATNK